MNNNENTEILNQQEIEEEIQEVVELTDEEKEELFFNHMLEIQALTLDENGCVLANPANREGIFTNPIDENDIVLRLTKREYLDFAAGKCYLSEDLTTLLYKEFVHEESPAEQEEI